MLLKAYPTKWMRMSAGARQRGWCLRRPKALVAYRRGVEYFVTVDLQIPDGGELDELQLVPLR